MRLLETVSWYQSLVLVLDSWKVQAGRCESTRAGGSVHRLPS